MKKRTARIKISPRGFTLVEMLVSVAIFSLVMVMALGALLSLSEANRKAELLSSAINNFESSLDSISRAARTGTVYHCGGGVLTGPRDCAATGATQFAFLASTGETVVYKRGIAVCANKKGCILRSTDGGLTFVSITSPEIVVTGLMFYVLGSSPNGTIQPKTIILISGYVAVKGGQNSIFNVETSVTQRIYDL